MRKKILYYISSHGYGHAARAGQVIRELLFEYDVWIKTKAPRWLLEGVIGARPPVFPDAYDIGCIQSNNMDVDKEGTISAYREQSAKNLLSAEKEVEFVIKKGVDLIISDIAPFPFYIAREASIPSLFIGNFTWRGIYSAFLSAGSGSVLDELHEQYSMAISSLVTPLAMEMPELVNSKKINLIARKGKNVREALDREFRIPEQNRLVFLYPGNLGFESVDPSLVEHVKGCSFISFYPMQGGLKNHIHLEDGRYRHQDIMASSDIALIKPGYGMVSEAMVNNTPFVYPPREDFVEYFAFLNEFRISGGSAIISRDDYESGNWAGAIERGLDTPYRKKYLSTGAKECKEEVARLLKSTRVIS